MSLSSGTQLGPYEILRSIGAGGMGEVYEARDTRLDRLVAVKVLPTALAGDPAAQARFEREAKAIAALNHPNICALFDVGRSEGHEFLVMERLEGETLQQKLQRGPLEIATVIEYGIALADALDAAHARGLIHRDLKPGNIFITTRGVPKILDFGLAKSLSDQAYDVTRLVDEALTRAGTSVGTVAYMSPEQLRAEPLDVRTDLFSIGLVLYEMATGQRAFTGSTSAVISAGILGHEPPAPRSLRADLPPRLEETILKTLEKDLTLRCQTAAELRADLRRAQRQGDSDPAASVVRTAAQPPVNGSAAATPASSSEASPPVPKPSRWTGLRRTRARRRRPAPSRWRSLLFIAIVGLFWAGSQWRGWHPFPDRFGTAFPGQPGNPQQPPFDGRGRDQGRFNGDRGFPPAGGPQEETPGARVDGATGRGRFGRGPFDPAMNGLVPLLRTAPPETYDLVFASNDPRSRELAFQLRDALTSAGWTTASTLEIPSPESTVGIFAPQESRGVGVLTDWARREGLDPETRVVPTLEHPRLVIGKQP